MNDRHKEPARTFCDVITDPRGGTIAFWEQDDAWITVDMRAVDRLENWE